MKISIGQNTQPHLQNSIHHPPSQPSQKPFSNSLQNGGVIQSGRRSNGNLQLQQQANYQLVNEYSSFTRPLAPVSPLMGNSKKFPQDRQAMLHSMPVNLPQFEQALNNSKHYITQNSMVENLGRTTFESSFTNY